MRVKLLRTIQEKKMPPVLGAKPTVTSPVRADAGDRSGFAVAEVEEVRRREGLMHLRAVRPRLDIPRQQHSSQR
jgi:hypothetical protein